MSVIIVIIMILFVCFGLKVPYYSPFPHIKVVLRRVKDISATCIRQNGLVRSIIVAVSTEISSVLGHAHRSRRLML